MTRRRSSGATILALILCALTLGGCRAGAKKGGSSGSSEEKVTIPETEISFTLVSLPGGLHEKQTVQPFWIGKHEVSWAEFRLFYRSTRNEDVDGVARPTQPDVKQPEEPFKNGHQQTDAHPAITIGWFNAINYCEWLSRKTGDLYRLPTELEWEYAARAGDTGKKPADLAGSAWHKENSGAHTHPIGTGKPNAWGLYDMLGNAWEHVAEPFEPPNFQRVVRGGAWHTPAGDVTYALRTKVIDEWAKSDPKIPLRLWWVTDAPFVGFRVIRIPNPGSEKDRKAAAKKVTFKNMVITDRGSRPHLFSSVTGEVSYEGDRPITELEVTVYYVNDQGEETLRDAKDKPTWNLVFPALAGGRQSEPIKKGDVRKFAVQVPYPHDEVGPLPGFETVGAKVTKIRFAK